VCEKERNRRRRGETEGDRERERVEDFQRAANVRDVLIQ